MRHSFVAGGGIHLGDTQSNCGRLIAIGLQRVSSPASYFASDFLSTEGASNIGKLHAIATAVSGAAPNIITVNL